MDKLYKCDDPPLQKRHMWYTILILHCQPKNKGKKTENMLFLLRLLFSFEESKDNYARKLRRLLINNKKKCERERS